MKLEIAHFFSGITPDEYEALYFDEAFTTSMSEAVRVARTVLRLERTPERVVRHQRCEPIRDVPAPIARFVGERRFAYLEELDFELGKGHGQWRVTPSIAADRVDAHGTLHFDAADGGMTRVVRGEIEIALFGIGALAERFVVGEVERSYADAADFTRRFLASRAR